FDAADAVPIAPAALAAFAPDDWPRLAFDTVPSVQLLPMQWTVEPLWRALQSVKPGEEPELPEPAAHAHALLVWRQGLENRWRSVDALQAPLLRAVLDGRAFGELCEIAAAAVSEQQAAASAVAALQSWLADGLLAGVRLPD